MDMKVRGVLIYECEDCNTFFSVSFQPKVSCPGCRGNNIKSLGDGCTYYNEEPPPLETSKESEELELIEESLTLETLLKAQDVADILSVSERVAYEIMEEKGFPLIRIRRSKRVDKTDFYEWLQQRKF
ncbi:helix-turn-helix domain-containing protein [Metabacillus fastidiosus]|uniref:helix-turn-helix domain-containing protein n=1 Tax=Metabacillus fastidiosus TaxID=1458 RepID=UPI003D2A2FE2